MKRLKRTKFVKQIIFIILIVSMLYNFIVPNYSYAVSTEGGGSMMDSLAKFICFIPDAVLDYLQGMLATPEKIKLSGENYRIKYSPAIIFAGEVPAFDINFIHPKEDKVVANSKSFIVIDDITTGDMGAIFSRLKNNKINSSSFEGALGGNPSGIINEVNTNHYFNFCKYQASISSFNIDSWIDTSALQAVEEFILGSYEHHYVWIYDNTIYMSVFKEVNYLVAHHMAYAVYSTTLSDNELQLFDSMATTSNNTKTYKSTSAILQNPVATWYNTLRRIALVGLLSVLVYIGIRILLTSTSAKDKAKYKSMLKDWLMALCILFTLHYIMNITIEIVNNITEIIKSSAIGANGEDVLMSTVRNEIARGDNWGTVITYVVIYIVLVVYTIMFSIQYIRRTIYLAFLTMIAPLITLTYPIDKIKDTKAQAFNTWLRDYIFFTLLQVVHLLIYYVLVGSSIDLANKGNWIYAIVAIGFLTTAEKLVKKMFGFEKSKSMGTLAAGATGALVMNAIDKVGKKVPKGSSNKSKQTTVRTANSNPLTQVNPNSNPLTQANPNSSLGPESLPVGNESNGGTSTSETLGENVATGTNATGESGGPVSGGNIPKVKQKPKRNIKNGAKALLGRYWRPVVEGVAKGTLGVLAGGTGAMLGFASGVAQGDLGKAVSGAFAGVAAGSALGSSAVDFVDGIPSTVVGAVDKVKDVWNEGTYGKEFAQSASAAREFKRTSAYRELRKDYEEILSDDKIRAMLDSDITDTKTMKKILKNHKEHPRKYSIDKAIAYSELAKKCPEEVLQKNSKFLKFCQDRNIQITEEEIDKLRKCIIDFK